MPTFPDRFAIFTAAFKLISAGLLVSVDKVLAIKRILFTLVTGMLDITFIRTSLTAAFFCVCSADADWILKRETR